MKIHTVFSILLITVNIGISSCGKNKDLEKDVANIAESMCKITGVMNKLIAADPADSSTISRLQLEEMQCQEEMHKRNFEFREKYKTQLSDKKFKEQYSREFRKAILNCPHLSKEDRERYEKEIE
jgi:hypothetical protein